MNDFTSRMRHHVDDLTPSSPESFASVVAGRNRRRRRRRTAVAMGAAMLSVAAIAVGTSRLSADTPSAHVSGPATPETTQTASPTPAPPPTLGNRPPPVVLHLADRDVDLPPSSWCWAGPVDAEGVQAHACADGYTRTKDLPDVGSPDAVDFSFAAPGWSFEATFTELGTDCPRQHTIAAVASGDHAFHLKPAGQAHRYRVDLFGRGPDGVGGDVATSFVWTTPTDGPIQQPTALLALVGGEEGELTTYGGLELAVNGLAVTPDQAAVTVTATAANGESLTLGAKQPDYATKCYVEGSLFFKGAPSEAEQVTQLGPAPFTYEVRLTLDGKDYLGTAVWPRDVKPDEAPYTVLSFDPPLPAFTG